MSKHNHYFKDVSQLSVIDVYRTLILFAVSDPCIQHAVKKLLVAGGRGARKDISQDIQEAIDSLERWKEMRQEENPIYNRRAGDKIQEIDKYPEVWPDDSVDHPEDEPRYRTTGKFKIGDKVSIHDVTEACVPDTFEGAIGEVIYDNGYDYSVKFNQEFHHNPEPVWCVYEWQMRLVTPVEFKEGDIVKINSHKAGKVILGVEKGVGTLGKVLCANEHCVDVEVIHEGEIDMAFYYPKELTLVR